MKIESFQQARVAETRLEYITQRQMADDIELDEICELQLEAELIQLGLYQFEQDMTPRLVVNN